MAVSALSMLCRASTFKGETPTLNPRQSEVRLWKRFIIGAKLTALRRWRR
jgi:hypothetical protein